MATTKKKPGTKVEPKVTSTGDGSIDIASSWARIERWFATNHPRLSLKLRAPAGASEIAAAEKTLGVSFPEDFRASLLVHDGQENEPDVRILPFAHRLGSLASLVQCWQDDRKYFDAGEIAKRHDWLDRAKCVRQVHLHPKQIPFAGSSYWDYDRLLFDYVPGPQGTEAQVIARCDIDLFRVCGSLGELLAKTAQGLEDGTAVVRDGVGDGSEVVYLAPKTKKTVDAVKWFGG